ncbi:MAG TPA: SCO family protein [Bryobacteraceae bacterium]|nr:SCO family protein [Bryobacteraceae bacterium]
MNVNERKLILLLALAIPMFAQKDRVPSGQPGALPAGVRPPQLEGVGVDEHLGRTVDLNLTFVAENGYPVALKEYFGKGKPVILDLVYYSCPMLCNLMLNGQTQVMREIPWTPGKEYEVVTISINPQESFDLSRKKRDVYIGSFDRAAPGWHFLVDKDDNAKKLAEQIGFHYRYDPSQDQYAHPAAIFILTPEGKIARYLYGTRFRPMDVRFALAEASENRTSMTVEKILLFCYQYDPGKHAYVVFATNIMRIGGALTVFIIAFFLWRMFRAEKARAHRLETDRLKAQRLKEGLA